MPKRYSDRDLAILRNGMGESIPVPPERKNPHLEESRIQRAVIKWWAAAHMSFSIHEHLLLSIPNGGRRDVLTAVTLKREGLRKGASDLFLSVKRGGYAGLWIEMKQPDGHLTPEQKDFQSDVTAQGYAAFTCYSFEQATNLISDYLNNRPIF